MVKTKECMMKCGRRMKNVDICRICEVVTKQQTCRRFFPLKDLEERDNICIYCGGFGSMHVEEEVLCTHCCFDLSGWSILDLMIENAKCPFRYAKMECNSYTEFIEAKNIKQHAVCTVECAEEFNKLCNIVGFGGYGEPKIPGDYALLNDSTKPVII